MNRQAMNTVLREIVLPNNHRFQLVHGDITEEHVDAIVNAANKTLQHGGGVARVIARKGGKIIQQQSDAWIREHGPITHDSPAFTECGALPCRYVIHAVGPIMGEGNENEKLASAITGTLKLADRLGIHSLAFTAISTGIYHFPKEKAAQIFFQTIPSYFAEHPNSSLDLVRLVVFDKTTRTIFLKHWDETQQAKNQ